MVIVQTRNMFAAPLPGAVSGKVHLEFLIATVKLQDTARFSLARSVRFQGGSRTGGADDKIDAFPGCSR